MFKIGPPAEASGTVWDEQGKSEIAQIYIGRDENRFKFIEFLYAGTGDRFATSGTLGLSSLGGCSFFDTITLGYPSEFINGISGFYEDDCGSKYLRSICFHTNKSKYGPFIASPAGEGLEQIEFSYQVGGNFFGFFGTFQQNGVESIGIYSKPMDNRSDIVRKNVGFPVERC